MRDISLLFLSGLFLGFASYVGWGKFDPQVGYEHKKRPPGLKTVDLVYSNTDD